MSTLLKHPATKDAITENVPVFECLLIDYNGNIHYILQKTITELNEILYWTFYQENSTGFQPDIELTADEIEDLLEYYQEGYHIGQTYSEISQILAQDDRIHDIIFQESIMYTRRLICSLNKGWIKKIYIALDGVPSKAKIKEQRNRRYMGTYINNLKEEITNKYRFKNQNIYQINLFNWRSVICAGTKFMEKIQQALFHLDIGLEIEVSTVHCKGEGEKKIVHLLDELTEYQTYCIMSPDSDMLILIGLLAGGNKFNKFVDKKLYNFRIDYQQQNKYQFFDVEQLTTNLQSYYSERIGKQVSPDKMVDMLFMLVVFGNDFLPKLEPLDIIKHFDFVCESCLKLSMNGLKFVQNNGTLNYRYLLHFFKQINSQIIPISIEQTLDAQYQNYQQLCKQMSVSITDLQQIQHHPKLKPLTVSYSNFQRQLAILTTSYYKLLDFVKETEIRPEQMMALYQDISRNINDSYLLVVLPRLVKFPGYENATDNYSFFKLFIQHVAMARPAKFRTRLIPKKYELKQITSSAYYAEIEKLNKSLEPYRSIFRMRPIILMEFDLKKNILADLRDKYYDTYVKPNMTKKEIRQMAIDYLVGIEWLYQYYISGKHLEWSGWFYNYSQSPLMDDLVQYLETNLECQPYLASILDSYPENNLTPEQNYIYVTPNDYTKAGVSPNLSDVIHLIDGFGAIYLNKCQIKWHEYEPAETFKN